MILAQGAEAILLKKGNTVIKQRCIKSYRHQTIDSTLRKFRTRREAKVLQTLNTNHISAPKFIAINEKDMTLTMDFVKGKKLKDIFDKEYRTWAPVLGKMVAQLHNNQIIHGDLTTSNFIVNDSLVVIDFGLSFFSHKIEDKAVDLHLLQQAVASKHSAIFATAFPLIVEFYTKNCNDASAVLKRFKVVESRGRNKEKY